MQKRAECDRISKDSWLKVTNCRIQNQVCAN